MYQQSIRFEDFPNICRFCLTQRSTETMFNPLFDEKNVSLTKTLTKMVDHCLGLKLTKDDDLPALICSGCLKKLLTFNAFRKQCISAEYQLKLLLNDYKERKLFEEIEGRLAKENPEEVELIEYIDESLELLNDEEKCDDDDEEDEIVIELDTTQSTESPYTNKMDDDVYEELESDDQIPDDTNIETNDEQIESLDEATTMEMEQTSKFKSKTIQDKKMQGRRPCKICGKMVVNLKPHMDTHVEIENRRKPYQCDYCGKEYLQRAQFDSHVNKEHTGLKPFKCDQCNKTFHGRPSLRMHKIQHSTERRFNCEYCPRSYLYAHHLSHHRYTHTKERLFSCEHCDYTNVHMENLKRHILSKHTEDEDKPYQCEVCSRSFNGQSNLKRHLKYVHSLVAKSTTDKNAGESSSAENS